MKGIYASYSFVCRHSHGFSSYNFHGFLFRNNNVTEPLRAILYRTWALFPALEILMEMQKPFLALFVSMETFPSGQTAQGTSRY